MSDNNRIEMITKMAGEVVAWVTSEEGLKILDSTLQQVRETTEGLEIARRVDEQSLHEPFTL